MKRKTAIFFSSHAIPPYIYLQPQNGIYTYHYILVYHIWHFSTINLKSLQIEKMSLDTACSNWECRQSAYVLDHPIWHRKIGSLLGWLDILIQSLGWLNCCLRIFSQYPGSSFETLNLGGLTVLVFGRRIVCIRPSLMLIVIIIF